MMAESEKAPEVISNKAESGHLFDQALFRNTDVIDISHAIEQFRKLGLANELSLLTERYTADVKKEFPKLQDEMRAKLDEQRVELDKLGSPRCSTERRVFLLDLVKSYWNFIRQCKDKKFAAGTGDHHAKIWLHVERLSREFCNNMGGERGAYIPFRIVHDDFNPEEDRIAGISFEDFDEQKGTTRNSSKTRNIYEWINSEFHMSMHRDCLGLVSPELIEHLFRLQTEPWLQHAQNYIVEIITCLQNLSRYALKNTETDSKVVERLEVFIKKQAEKRKSAAFLQVSKVYMDEHDRLHTYDDRFREQLAKSRAKRLVASVKRAKANYPKTYENIARSHSIGDQPKPEQEDNGNSLELSRYCEMMVWHSNHQYPLTSVYEIHDILLAYYFSSIYHFLEKIKKIANELVMNEYDSFFHVLNNKWVMTLSENQLEDIVGETSDITTNRNRITNLIERLEEAINLSEAIRPRIERATIINTEKSSNENLRPPEIRFRRRMSDCGSETSANDGSVQSGRSSPSFSEEDLTNEVQATES